ncbi:signal peptidase I [Pseudobdellovibrio exovorus]|uniref:Signal peptidase I n=1 Tax=Pseudobdellovibrio exovorus JSS TaxID=1184267 RepID=M4VPB1_9BACT|nr:signal peptidase I [Pseudobdellovibrio exovorus]AGH94964.1 hypothetical protein A11Q_744 [Pseudobdellovibrio exovorus JSS]
MKYTIVAIAIAGALFFRAFLISVYKVTTQSMAPVMLSGDFVLSSQYSYGLRVPWDSDVYFQSAPKRGELVVFSKNYKTYIKRVVAVERDEVAYQQGILHLNAQPCSYETIATQPELLRQPVLEVCGERQTPVMPVLAQEASKEGSVEGSAVEEVAKTKLNSGQILVASDNRDTEGAVEIVYVDQIIGKPLFVWMSFASTQDSISATSGIRWNRILTKLQ